MKSIGKIVLTLVATGCLAVGATEESIDAKDGVLSTQPDVDYVIGSDTGTGDGITLATPEVTIQSLRHDTIRCEAKVLLGNAEALRLTTVKVGGTNELAFSGVDSTGLTYPESDTDGKMYLDVGYDSVLTLTAPLTALSLYKLGDGEVVSSEPFTSTVSNAAGAVYFGSDSGLLGVRSVAPFIYQAACNSLRGSEVTVDQAQNGGAGVQAQIASCLAEDTTELDTLLVGGGHDVEIVEGFALANLDFLDVSEDYVETVPDSVIVGSNSVGVLRVNGALISKLAIADGASASAKGAVYVGERGAVTNFSAVAGEALLGRSGYAALDVAGEYVAYGGWFGAVSGQLSLNISGVFRHPDAEERASTFNLGGLNAYAAVTVSGTNGLFDVSGMAGDITLPKESAASGVTLTVEEDGLIDFGTNMLTIANRALVNLNGGGTLATVSLVAQSPAFVQADGGYLCALAGGEAFAGTVYAQSGGFGLDVPEGLTAEINESCKPLAATGKGVEAIALGTAVAGVKFIGPPLVVITDSFGKGASAVAEMADGEVTAIRVTGRGVNYNGATAKLVYGTDEYALGNVTLTGDEAGPLLKRGSGTLEVETTTQLQGLEIYAGTVRAVHNNIVQPTGPIYIAEGAVFDAGEYQQRFSTYSGSGSIINGPITVDGLVVDMERAKLGDVDTLDFNQVVLADNAGIELINFSDLERVPGRYVIYHLGAEPESVPTVSEKTYAAGLDRGWTVEAEGADLVLRYIGGSIFIFY